MIRIRVSDVVIVKYNIMPLNLCLNMDMRSTRLHPWDWTTFMARLESLLVKSVTVRKFLYIRTGHEFAIFYFPVHNIQNYYKATGCFSSGVDFGDQEQLRAWQTYEENTISRSRRKFSLYSFAETGQYFENPRSLK